MIVEAEFGLVEDLQFYKVLADSTDDHQMGISVKLAIIMRNNFKLMRHPILFNIYSRMVLFNHSYYNNVTSIYTSIYIRIIICVTK